MFTVHHASRRTVYPTDEIWRISKYGFKYACAQKQQHIEHRKYNNLIVNCWRFAYPHQPCRRVDIAMGDINQHGYPFQHAWRRQCSVGGVLLVVGGVLRVMGFVLWSRWHTGGQAVQISLKLIIWAPMTDTRPKSEARLVYLRRGTRPRGGVRERGNPPR